jgi:hypothetical protein
MAFISHLKIDHEIFYVPQRMTETKANTKMQAGSNRQALTPPE